MHHYSDTVQLWVYLTGKVFQFHVPDFAVTVSKLSCLNQLCVIMMAAVTADDIPMQPAHFNKEQDSSHYETS